VPSTDVREALRLAIAGWLEAEREIYARLAANAGLSPSITYQSARVVNYTDTSMTSEGYQRQVSAYTIPAFAWALADLRSKVQVGELSVGRALFDAYGKQVFYWSTNQSLQFADDPITWIERNILLEARARYLSSITSLETGEADVRSSIASGVLEFVEADAITIVTTLALGGIRLPQGPIREGQVLLRPLREEELVRTAERQMELRMRPGGMLQLSQLTREQVIRLANSERVALELTTRQSKLEPPNVGLRANRLVLALQLLGLTPFGGGYGHSEIADLPGIPAPGVHVRIPVVAQWAECDGETLSRAVRLSDRIPDEMFSEPRTRKTVALHRFSLGAEQEYLSEALIDYVIALEAILLPPEKEGELSYRFRLHGAWFIGRTREERERLRRELRDIYDARSSLVHGLVPKPDEVTNAGRLAATLSARILVKALEEGWPTADQLADRALGA
jgi:hypothetical protein